MAKQKKSNKQTKTVPDENPPAEPLYPTEPPGIRIDGEYVPAEQIAPDALLTPAAMEKIGPAMIGLMAGQAAVGAYGVYEGKKQAKEAKEERQQAEHQNIYQSGITGAVQLAALLARRRRFNEIVLPAAERMFPARGGS